MDVTFIVIQMAQVVAGQTMVLALLEHFCQFLVNNTILTSQIIFVPST